MTTLPVVHHKCVIVVLYRRTGNGGEDVEYLLFERILNWKGVELCKGSIDPGETPAEAALREAEEESGVRPAKVVPTGSIVKYGFNSRDKDGNKVRIEREFQVFLADITDSITDTAPRADGLEHKRVWFAPYDKAVRSLTYTDMKNLLRELHPRIVAEDSIS